MSYDYWWCIMYKKAEEKIELMKGFIQQTKYREDAVKLFIKNTGMHISTAYDYYLLATTGIPSKRITNSKLRAAQTRASSKNCYFCGNKSEEGHHYDYLKDKKVSLCQSCHGRVHFIFESYHNAIVEKDKMLMQIKQIIFSR